MPMMGTEGPYRDCRGYGLTIAAAGGLLGLTGYRDRPPVGTGTNYPDHVPNPGHAAFALLAALRHQRRTGVGQYIDIAQTEPMVALLGTQILEYTANGHDPQPLGNADLSACPQGVYPCLGDDRWLAVTVENDTQWAALVPVLDLIPQPGWETAAGRRVAADAVDAAIAAATRRRDAVELMRTLQAAGVPAGVVNNVVDVVDRDPQLAHRGHWVRLPHPEMGQTLYNAPPFRFSAMSIEYRRGAPLLGEHTAEVCREVLGMPDEEITRLTDDGVLT
jgi:benzylsuccinate CoA-transferase BbsF subunit